MRTPLFHRTLLTAAAIATLLTGCVAKSKYLKEQDRANDLDKQMAQLNSQLKASEQANTELTQKLQSTQQTADELARQKKEQDDLVNALADEIQSKDVKISQIAGKLSINMVDKILFDSGSAQLKSDGKKVLMKVGSALKKVQDKRIWVAGHTDNVAISSSLRDRFDSNWELSSARATSVVRFLEDKAGISGERLSAAGNGQYQPVGDNKTPEGRQLNRRIEILLIPTKETMQNIKP